MSAKKRTDEQDNGVAENPFQPEMGQINPEFKFTDLMESFKTKLIESDKKKTTYGERVRKNLLAIERVKSLIDQLQNKMAQENSSVWVSQIVKPLAEQIQLAFTHAVVEVTPMSGSAMITLSKKNVSPADKLKGIDARSVVVVPQDSSIGIRDFSRSNNDYAPGSPGALAFLNHPIVAVPPEKTVETLIEWLTK